MKMTNKFDKYIEKERSKGFNESSEIKDFLVEVLRSKEILKLAPINEIGTYSPGPFFYMGTKKLIDEIISKKIKSLDEFNNGKNQGIIGILREVHICATPKDNDMPCSEYEITFERGGNNIIPTNSDLEINKLASELNLKHMIEAGFSYDSNLEKLTPHTGNEMKEITKENLEKCLQEYFIKPCLKCPNYRI